AFISFMELYQNSNFEAFQERSFSGREVALGEFAYDNIYAGRYKIIAMENAAVTGRPARTGSVEIVIGPESETDEVVIVPMSSERFIPINVLMPELTDDRDQINVKLSMMGRTFDIFTNPVSVDGK